MTHPIHPPAYKPTEQEHRIAFLTWCLNDIVYEELLFQNMLRDPHWLEFFSKASRPEISEDPVAYGRHRLEELLNRLFKDKEGPKKDLEPWERLRDYEEFKKSNDEHLASHHCGDCTAVAATCLRCYSEDLYKVPNTVTWKGKSEGWKLLNDYVK